MEIVLELLVFVAEIVGESLLQVLVELGARSLAAPFKREGTVHPAFTAVGYVIFGAVGGAISLWIFPALFVSSPPARIANLLITPIAAGLAMAALGAWRVRKGRPTLAIDRFACGYLFALAMGGVRFAFGR